MKPPLIKTKHCLIKLLDVDQSHLLFHYYQKNKQHLNVWEPKRDSDFYTLEFWQQQVAKSMQLFNAKQGVRLVALNPEQTHVVATCNFSNIVWGSFQACHLGYSIDQDYEGKGRMFEVATAGIDYIFNDFRLHRIMANHMPENKRSAHLLKHLGFEKEGYAKDYLKINGQWRDHILNALVLSKS